MSEEKGLGRNGYGVGGADKSLQRCGGGVWLIIKGCSSSTLAVGLKKKNRNLKPSWHLAVSGKSLARKVLVSVFPHTS